MKSDKDIIFCIDTSALITMHRYYPRNVIPDLWRELEKLFKTKSVISHEFVYDEIIPEKGEKDDLGKLISKFRTNFKGITKRQAQLVPEILLKFPKLIDPDIIRDQADPWLIAMLIEIREGLYEDQSEYVLVSTESEKKQTKIPAACKYFNLQHMNLFRFFEANGWKLKVEVAK
jgi:hypothetical protein